MIPNIPFLCTLLKLITDSLIQFHLILSWQRSLSCRNLSIDLLWKSVDWFLYDRDLRHERVRQCSYSPKYTEWPGTLRILGTENTGILLKGKSLYCDYGELLWTFYLKILRCKMIFLSRLCISGSFNFILMHI